MIRAKKSLGQNFLTNTTVVTKMIDALDIQTGDTVVEIGPGKGFLTRELVQTKAKHIQAIEMDQRMIEVLQTELQSAIQTNKLSLQHQDILEWTPKTNNYKVIGNIPFYITGAIIKHILDSEQPPIQMVLLMQKEVAERIVMRDGKNSILGTAVSIYCQPKIICTVKPGSFSPPPKVSSAVVHFSHILQPFHTQKDREDFFVFLRQVFAGKRKMLTTNLKPFFPLEKIQETLTQAGHTLSVRAEDLTPKQILALWKTIKNPQEYPQFFKK